LILYDGAVPSAGELPFPDLCGRVQERIEGRYRVRVVTRDIPDPLIGDLNGSEIHIDFAVTPEQRLFLLAHLFGHTVQWNCGISFSLVCRVVMRIQGVRVPYGL
jgi:hypothetical protein